MDTNTLTRARIMRPVTRINQRETLQDRVNEHPAAFNPTRLHNGPRELGHRLSDRLSRAINNVVSSAILGNRFARSSASDRQCPPDKKGGTKKRGFTRAYESIAGEKWQPFRKEFTTAPGMDAFESRSYRR